MNKQHWKIDNDKTSVHSLSEVYIPWLGFSIKAWFEIEENQTWWTDRQIRAFEEILASIDWKRSHMCIPQHYESKNQYMLLLPETKWKLTDSDFTFELEILFTNGKIEIAQEMSGLWNRIEWFEDYLKRKTTYNTI